MRVDAEVAGIIVAVGFLVMGVVSMPLATGFVLGAMGLGVVVALLIRFTPRKFSRVVLGGVLILAAGILWWLGHKPGRPPTVSSKAVYVLPSNGRFTLRRTGFWFDCRFDQHSKVDRCELTDEDGNRVFEDVFLPCVGDTPISQSDLVFKQKSQWTGYTWTTSPDKRISVPILELQDGQVLLPQSFYAEAKSDVYCPAR